MKEKQEDLEGRSYHELASRKVARDFYGDSLDLDSEPQRVPITNSIAPGLIGYIASYISTRWRRRKGD